MLYPGPSGYDAAFSLDPQDVPGLGHHEELRKSLAQIRHNADEGISDLVEALGPDAPDLAEDAIFHLEWIIGEVDRLIGPRTSQA